MEFSPYTNLNVDLSNNGIIRLWASPNLMNSEWRLTGDITKDINSYFYLPADVIIINGELKYNNSYEYVKKEITVTGWCWYKSKLDLQEGKTEPFWHMVESENKTLKLETDDLTKMPFIMTPTLGRFNYTSEKRYFSRVLL